MTGRKHKGLPSLDPNLLKCIEKALNTNETRTKPENNEGRKRPDRSRVNLTKMQEKFETQKYTGEKEAFLFYLHVHKVTEVL